MRRILCPRRRTSEFLQLPETSKADHELVGPVEFQLWEEEGK